MTPVGRVASSCLSGTRVCMGTLKGRCKWRLCVFKLLIKYK
uniref:Uncharacterized protein n=1 Tax=Anguilla anguilla TaxID=7936 RepID=A0A0E9XGC6_ANGAN